MNILACFSLLSVALLVSGFSLGLAPARADEWPEDTNKIERLTPEQARKLAEEFPGVDVQIEIKGYGKHEVRACLPMNGLTTLDVATAKARAEFKGYFLFLNGLTTLDANTAKVLAESKAWSGDLSAVTALDSVAIAKALATRKGRLKLPNLKKISPKTLTALPNKEDAKIPLIETLELIQEPDGSATDDFVIPEWLEERQKQQRAAQAAE